MQTGNRADLIRLRCGDLEIDTVRQCLLISGEQQQLRSQTFQVLEYLARSAGRTVSKEVLLAAIWADTSVTDNALVQCIAEIRKVLQDDPKQPRYIKTLPKIGYRCLVQFEAISDSSEPSTNLVAATLGPLSDGAGDRTDRHQPGTAWSAWQTALFLAAVAVIAVCALWVHRSRRNTRTEPKVTASPGIKRLRIQPFKNLTGDPSLTWVASAMPSLLQEKLRSGRDVAVELAPDGRGASDVISGTILRDSDHFRLKVETRSNNGTLLHTENVPADRAEFPQTADLVAELIASQMGLAETNGTLQEEAATTRSVRAANYYQLGVLHAQGFETAEAVEFLKKAIAIDPSFAMAYARVGYAYAVADFRLREGLPFLERASSLSSSLPERHRLYVEAWKATAEQQFGRAELLYQSILARYPSETEAYVQLAKLQRSQELLDAASATIQRGLEFNPSEKALLNVLVFVRLAQHRNAEAFAAAHEYVNLAPKEPNAHDTLGMALEQTGSTLAALAEYSAALSLNPKFEPALLHMGEAYFRAGRYDEAVTRYQTYIDAVDSREAKAIGYGELATVYMRKGDLERAAKASQQEQHYNANAVWNSLVVAVETRQSDKARHLEADLQRLQVSQERGTPGDRRTLAYERGWLAMHHGQPTQAIAYFREAVRHLPPSSGIDFHETCVADAFAQLGMRQQAELEYQRVLSENPGDPGALSGITSMQHM